MLSFLDAGRADPEVGPSLGESPGPVVQAVALVGCRFGHGDELLGRPVGRRHLRLARCQPLGEQAHLVLAGGRRAPEGRQLLEEEIEPAASLIEAAGRLALLGRSCVEGAAGFPHRASGSGVLAASGLGRGLCRRGPPFGGRRLSLCDLEGGPGGP